MGFGLLNWTEQWSRPLETHISDTFKTWTQGITIVLHIINILWFIKVHWDMGMNWYPKPTVLENHKLVDTGVFSVARHPMYMSLFYEAIPFMTMTRSWLCFVWWYVCMIPLFFKRIPEEEEICIGLFGEEYMRYQQKVPTLGPFTMGIGNHFLVKDKGEYNL